MPIREKGFAMCLQNRGAEDLEVRKVYRVLPDKEAAATGYVRIIDESGEDYLYPADYFVFVALPEKAKRAWPPTQIAARRRSSSNKALQRPELALLAPAAERQRSPHRARRAVSA